MGRSDTFPKTLLLPVVLWLLAGCGVTNSDDPEDGSDFELDPVVYPIPYSEPSVSADGEIVVFKRIKVTHVNRREQGFSTDPDSTGLWMIRSDGTGMKMLMQGMHLNKPGLSPDGQWLAFETGAQIYKASFDGQAVDTTGIVQLTDQGRNFSPAWSPDGEWIAYRRSYMGPEPPNVQGIWIMQNDASEQQQLFSGNSGEATWHPSGLQIAFFRGVINTSGNVVGDSLWAFRFDNQGLERITFLSGDNRSPTYSPDGSKIAFNSQGKIWVMNSDGSDPVPIAEHAGWPSWTPDGRIVYVQGASRQFKDNGYGTLWIMDANGGNKQQLTFNHGLQWM